VSTVAVPLAVDPDRAEPGLTLADPQPRTLGFFDQTALWGNLGISLLGPVTAVFVIAPGMSFLAAFVAVVVGTVIGVGGVALANVAGARTGRPAMVMLRGLFGAKLSYLPTVLNLVQVLGWGIFELVIIAQATRQLLPWHGAQWPYVLIGGAVTTVMAIWPLGSVRMLRRYALIAVLLAMAYLFVQLLRQPLPSLTHGGFGGFWTSVDLVIAVSVSWIPLAADYTRFARTRRTSFWGASVGYLIPVIWLFGFGAILVLSHPALDGDPTAVLTTIAAGGAASILALLALTVDESDEAFANVYSGAVSLQNLVPHVPQRVLVGGFAATATLGALVVDLRNYQTFLYLLGSFFVPLFAVLLADWLLAGRHYDRDAVFLVPDLRVEMIAAWLAGFALYQWLSPQGPAWWTRIVAHFHPHSLPWGGASLPSFAAAFGLAVLARAVARRGTVDFARPA